MISLRGGIPRLNSMTSAGVPSMELIVTGLRDFRLENIGCYLNWIGMDYAGTHYADMGRELHRCVAGCLCYNAYRNLLGLVSQYTGK